MSNMKTNEHVTIPEDWRVEQIKSSDGKMFIREHHYSRGCHNGPMCWGLLDGESNLLGVIAFATPSSEAVRSSLFGPEHKSWVTELHRLVILDGTPPNAESWLIARALRGLKEYRPQIRAVISFADSTEGHVGTIYQATNALFCGTTGSATFYRDSTGRLRHPRQNGVNISKSEAARRGWVAEKRGAKNRYVFLLGSPKEKRRLRSALLRVPEKYPKIEEAPDA